MTKGGGLGLYYSPTHLIRLTDDGLQPELRRLGEGATPGWPSQATEEAKAMFGKPGVFTIQVEGAIARGKAEAVPFVSGLVRVQVGAAGHKPLAEIVAAARAEVAKQRPELKGEEPIAITEDERGNRQVRFRKAHGPWHATDSFLEVEPDGRTGNLVDRPMGFCVAAGTLLDTASGPQPIEGVRVGDRIWGCDSDKQVRVLTAVRVIRSRPVDATLIFGKTLRVTSEHPLFANRIWKQAGAVAPDDELLTDDLRRVPAGRSEKVTGRVAVYDLTVDEPHNFFAGGFLVHNKDRCKIPIVLDLTPAYPVQSIHLQNSTAGLVPVRATVLVASRGIRSCESLMLRHHAVYIRHSGGPNQDISSQRNALLEKTAHLNDVVVYTDEISGRTTKRPEYQKLLNAIRAGKVSKVFTWKYDRIGRNAADNLAFAEECKARSTDIVSVSDGQTLLSPTDGLLFTILSAIAQYEREKISENTLRGMAYAKAQGKILGGSVVGWTAKQTIDKLPTILLLKEQGYTQRRIAAELRITRKTVARALKLHAEGKIVSRATMLADVPLERRGKKFLRELADQAKA